MNSHLNPEQLAARYSLLCRATHPTPLDDPHPVAAELDQLHALIDRDLLELARRGSPDHFADLYLAFGRELERFREFCAFPALAQKVVVGFGGAFSAGKSSLINTLLGERLLVTEVDPTTSLPTYLLHGAKDAIYALNLNRHRIGLSENEFKSLTHDEMPLYGSTVGGLLRAAFITRADFPWPNLALIDTPGYSKPEQDSYSARTDENLARSQLNAAQAIVWVVSAKAGGITENDLNFLATLDRAIPRLVVVSRADSLPAKDISAILDGIRRTLAERGLPVLEVIPASSRKKAEYPLAPVLVHLNNWNRHNRQLRFAHNFKALFTRYARSIEAGLRDAHWQNNRFNRILALIDDDDIRTDTNELKAGIDDRIRQLKIQAEALHTLRRQFFAGLKRVGDKAGIALPEPDDIELLDEGGGNLLDLLITARDQRGGQTPDARQLLRALTQPGACGNQRRLQNATQAFTAHSIAGLDEHEREHYALLLAAVLRVRPAIGAAQSRVFALLLEAMGLANRQAALFERAQALTAAGLSESRRLLDEHDLDETFMLDALVLLRLEGTPSDDGLRLCTELADLLRVDGETLSALIALALHVLGVKALQVFPEALDPDGCPHWLQEVTAAKLKAGLQPGLWYIKHPIEMDAGWSLKNVTLFFVEGAKLETATSKDTKVTINDCRLIRPVMQFEGKTLKFAMKNCRVEGIYPEHEQLTAFRFDDIQAADFTNTSFMTENARTIHAIFTPLKLAQCQFTGCGNPHLVGGALAIRTVQDGKVAVVRLTDCRLIRCIARLGGALRIDQLQYNAITITGCLFDDYSATDPGMDYAVYASKIFTSEKDQPFIKRSQFKRGSFYLGNSYGCRPCFSRVTLTDAKLHAEINFQISEYKTGITATGDSEIRTDVTYQLPAWAEEF